MKNGIFFLEVKKKKKEKRKGGISNFEDCRRSYIGLPLSFSEGLDELLKP